MSSFVTAEEVAQWKVMYEDQKLAYKVIARRTGRSKDSVMKHLKAAGVISRPAVTVLLKCPACAKPREYNTDHPERRAKCIDCWKIVRKECVKKYHDSPKGKRNTRRGLLKAYKLDLEGYDRILQRQNGRCAICLNPPKEGGVLQVDHCHATGTVRGLLCGSCNRAIGLLKDSADALRRAANYLAGIHG